MTQFAAPAADALLVRETARVHASSGRAPGPVPFGVVDTLEALEKIEEEIVLLKLGSRQDEADREKERFESRSFSVFPDEEGMYVVKAKLTPEPGALLMRAVEAASDSLYREKSLKNVSAETSFEDAAHRRADALGLVAERALAAGFGESAPVSGTKAGRYQVLLHVDAERLWWGKDRQPAFIDPRGQTHLGRPREAPELEPNPVEALIEETRSRGADPDFYTSGARWKRTRPGS
jgi:hypothetical protein